MHYVGRKVQTTDLKNLPCTRRFLYKGFNGFLCAYYYLVMGNTSVSSKNIDFSFQIVQVIDLYCNFYYINYFFYQYNYQVNNFYIYFLK